MQRCIRVFCALNHSVVLAQPFSPWLGVVNELLACEQVIERDGTVVHALRSRRQIILDNIRDNDEAGTGYQKVLPYNLSGYLLALTTDSINYAGD